MDTIVQKTKEWIRGKYDESSATLLFHNWELKRNLVGKAKKLIEGVELDEEKGEILILTVLCMDLYFLKGTTTPLDEYDEITAFLLDQKYPKEKVEKVTSLLKFVHSNQNPETEMERLITDVRYAFISDKNYPLFNELWREETQSLENKNITLKEWREDQLRFFRTSHRYHTDYALENWTSRKKKNLKKLVKAKKKDKALVKKEKIKARFKDKIVDRGVQTLYRVTLRNHIKLSDIADTKANILLSVNAIIISLSLANLIPKLDNPSNTYLIYPTFIFIIFCVVSMILSVLATRPNVTKGEFTREDVKEKKVNLLFFGNFHRMKLENYEWAMKELIEDRDYIYSSLTKDLYFLGVVLERKYRLLRWTYTIFMVGMIVSVLIFGVSLKFFGPDRMLQ